MLSVVIPTYKNVEKFIDKLRKNLPYINDCEIIIVNDDPNQSIKEALKEFKHIILIENNKNLGFSATVNKGVKHATQAYVLLLNNDVILTDNTYKQALKVFEKDTTVFAVSFAEKERNNEIVGKNIISWENHFFVNLKADNLQAGYNAWAIGGSCLIDKKKFDELNGFDDLYSPFYWEDVDLSYRAWKLGYKVLFDPTVVVEHHHASTINQFYQNSFVSTIAFRNQLIFIWKNITDQGLLQEHVLYLLPFLFLNLVKGNVFYWKGFLQAVQKLPQIIEKKSMLRKQSKVSDQKIIAQFAKFKAY